MYNKKRILAIIPARGGSKGLPRKNILPICGKPLISWTIERANHSKHLDKVIVSTDCEEIANVALDAGAEVPFLRPEKLATDHSPTIDVIEHAVSQLQADQDFNCDYIFLLEPTSPLREDRDIDNMIEALIDKHSQFDSIISIGEVNEHPSYMKRLIGDEVEPFWDEIPTTTRRQDNETAYFPYGVGYFAKTQELLKNRTFYLKRCTFYKIKRYQNYEIDDIHDFWCVESIMKRTWNIS